ncbi:MAG TPA: RNA polymerase sigma factor [Streptosporangiaceae bacterium]|nr:RNA polymerase sigma factor [Streptosporangiaceae bacterium]
MSVPEAHRAVEAVWRLESARIIAGLARMVRDVGLAEDLAQEALVAALRQWPQAGIPPSPGAWLMATAKHHAVDRVRRDERLRRNVDLLGHDLRARQQEAVFGGSPDLDAVADDDFVPDDVLRLMFVACHPVLSAEARVALTLRLIGGLSTAEIARAFLTAEPTIAQRIVRAKRTLAEKEIPFEVPPASERPARLASVLEVVYLIFNEGYTATAGDDWTRPELCYEALRLGRMLAGLSPGEPEVHGLVALMEIQSSRMRARLGPAGEPIPLLEQNRGLWDQLLIRRGFAALLLAQSLGRPAGPYVLQAAIAACHARARSAGETDWAQIAALYELLGRVMPTPVVELNRAVAVGMAFGPARGLELADALAAQPELRSYHLLPTVRADFLAKLGRQEESRAEYTRAASLTRNEAERAVLLERAAASSRREP